MYPFVFVFVALSVVEGERRQNLFHEKALGHESGYPVRTTQKKTSMLSFFFAKKAKTHFSFFMDLARVKQAPQQMKNTEQPR
jgi:hypothetical protein